MKGYGKGNEKASSIKQIGILDLVLQKIEKESLPEEDVALLQHLKNGFEEVKLKEWMEDEVKLKVAIIFFKNFIKELETQHANSKLLQLFKE
jgi:hypothetical protein